jgi:hypothetical protein
MPEESSLSTSARVAAILFLVANFAAAASDAPLGSADMASSRFYWMLLLVVLAIISLIYYFSKAKSPVQVLGLAYDKANHKLELTVKNTGDEKYYIKSALRLLQPAEDVVKSATNEGNIPMAAARASVGNRRLFQLLCEDDAPVTLEPAETRTISYDVLLPQEHIKLDASKNVEVHIAYNEETDAPAPIVSLAGASDGFCIKLNSGEVIAEVFLLEDLLEALAKSPQEAIANHIKDGNEFAAWVRTVVGDSELAEALESVKYETSAEAKAKIIGILEGKVESLKHPYLRKVSAESKFYLKSGHDSVISEVIMLEELAEKLASSPAEAVSFHTRDDGNDFAAWVRHAVGDAELADKLTGIRGSAPEETKNKMVSAIRERVDSLKT